MIKVTAGNFKNQSLETISKFVRPTSSLKREAFFSIIDSYMLKNKINYYHNKIFLDLFAGIGTMGLEAISRGMQKSIFYENNREVVKILGKNCKKFCNNEQYKIVEDDVNISDINEEFQNISIIYIDPPYQVYDINKLLHVLENKVTKNSIVAVETSIKDKFIMPNSFKLLKKKEYRKTNISLMILS